MSKADQNREAYQTQARKGRGGQRRQGRVHLLPRVGQEIRPITPGCKKWRDNFATG